MNCAQLHVHLSQLYQCKPTDRGLRVTTSCLFPGFSQVSVYVIASGEGFVVHDGGTAFQEGWNHGRDDPLIRKIITKEALRYRVKLDGQTLTSEIMSSEWLPSAILAVSNAAAMTARQSIDHSIAAFEANISEKIYLALRKVYAESRIMREFSVDGQSGKQHNFDYAVGNIDSKILLLDAISPHHSSIAHKYTSFSDVKSALNGLAVTFAVYDRPLDPEDVSLMQQVSDLVPINSVSSGAERVLQ